jgi:hypothetical protein
MDRERGLLSKTPLSPSHICWDFMEYFAYWVQFSRALKKEKPL